METQYFLNEAEAAMNEFVKAQQEAKDFVLAFKGSVKQIKKDAAFIKLSSRLIKAKQLWYDYNTAALIAARAKFA
jgi:hypothetical protein